VLHLDARHSTRIAGWRKPMEGLCRSMRYVAERYHGCSVAHGWGTARHSSRLPESAPPRARLIRGIALELEQLYNHVNRNICAGASFTTAPPPVRA
jgi:Ni,Fe-hydrogenase III large subunit